MGLRLLKPWQELSAATIEALPGQVGVYHLGDAGGTVVKIGYAGGRELFGMQSALGREMDSPAALPEATQFRVEFTHNYLSRWEELLMLHVADHQALPIGNADYPHPVGRLRPD